MIQQMATREQQRKVLSLAQKVANEWTPAGGEWVDPLMTVELYDALEALDEYLEEDYKEDK